MKIALLIASSFIIAGLNASPSYANIKGANIGGCNNASGCELNNISFENLIDSINNSYRTTFSNGRLRSEHQSRFMADGIRSTRVILGHPINCGSLFDNSGGTKYSAVEVGGEWYFVYGFTETDDMIRMDDNGTIYNHTGIDLSVAQDLGLEISQKDASEDTISEITSSWNNEGFIKGSPDIIRNNSPSLIIPTFFCDSRIPDNIVERMALDKFKFCSDNTSNQNNFSQLYSGAMDLGVSGGNFTNVMGSNFDVYDQVAGAFSDQDLNRVRDLFASNKSGYCIPDTYRRQNNSTLDQYCEPTSKSVRTRNFGGRALIQSHFPNINEGDIGDISALICKGELDVRLRVGEERKVMVGENNNLFYGHMTFQCNRDSNGNLRVDALDNEGGNCNPEAANFLSSQNGLPRCSEEICMYTGGLSCTDTTVVWGENNQCWGDLTLSYSQVPTSGNARVIHSEGDMDGTAFFHCIDGTWKLSGQPENNTTCN